MAYNLAMFSPLLSQCLLALLCCATAASQALKAGDPAPDLSGKAINSAPEFNGWKAYKGKYVIVDFWATWCEPCTTALPRIAALNQQFKGQRVQFLTVAMDDPSRAEDFLKRNNIELATYIDGPSSTTSEAFGVYGIPVAAVINPQGRIVAVTSGDNITGNYIQSLLKGEPLSVPALEQPVDLDWDKTQISWQDGVQPMFEAIIKPIQVRGSGIIHEPGSNRISGDGLPFKPMVQYAWSTDSFHTEFKMSEPAGLYRAVVVVPKGRENVLFSTFQAALQSTFGFQVAWIEEERNVLVLKSVRPLPTSSADSVFQFLRGRITLHKQTITKLAEVLPNWTQMPVVDETHLQGEYDFDLQYRDDRPDVLTSEMKSRYGLTLEPAKRKIRVLVVEPAAILGR